jgi:tRNA A37 threonylcarbamoyltransferase TsaD
VDVLVAKTVRAARDHKVRTVFLAGGVAANKALRDGLAETMASVLPSVRYVQPQLAFCTDNAAMIAIAAYYNALRRKPDAWETMRVKIGWEIGRTRPIARGDVPVGPRLVPGSPEGHRFQEPGQSGTK